MPEVKETIKTLADSMIARFTPPEFWPGCQVMDVTDKDFYTTDNGYIEAIVGPHGQQRVRYQGFPPNAGTSNFFVDVEFFPAYHLYKVFGTGEGGTAKTGGYKVDKVFTPDLSGTVLYSDNGGTVTYPNSDIVMKDSAGTARIMLDPGTPSTEAFWEVRDQTGALKLRLSTDNSYRFLVSRGGLDVSQNIFRVDVTGTPQLEWDEGNDAFLWNKGHTISAGDLALSAGGITIIGNTVPVIVSSVTKTVQASGGDFTTIQGAVDWFKNKLIVGACIIDVEAGTYDEAVTFQDIFCGNNASLTLQGDTRLLAGMSYVDGAVCNTIGKTNGGTGTVSLSNSGTTLTVTMSTTNPDFDADGWGNGDKIIAYDNAGTTTEYTISSVLNNVFTLTTTAPTIGNDGTAIVLKPNRLIDRSTAGPCVAIYQAAGVAIDGFYLESATGANCNGIQVLYGTSAFATNCLAIVEDFGFYANAYFSSLDCSSGDNSAWGCTRGFYADPTAVVLAIRAVANNCSQGYAAQNLSSVSAQFGIAVNCATGFLANVMSNLAATGATARQNTTGYQASTGTSFLNATTTNANNNGNGTDYNPAPTVPGYAQATSYAVLFAS